MIFVTAYDEHAVRAFEAEALDFLVKPVPDERLRGALERAVRRVADARALRATLDTAPDSRDEPPRFLQQIIIPERGRQLVVPVDEIEWIEGDTYYVRIHAQGRVRLLRERLSRLEASLDPARFHRITSLGARTHRSHPRASDGIAVFVFRAAREWAARAGEPRTIQGIGGAAQARLTSLAN